MGGVGVGVGVGDGEGEKGREGMLGVLVAERRKPGVWGGYGIWYTLLLLARGAGWICGAVIVAFVPLFFLWPKKRKARHRSVTGFYGRVHRYQLQNDHLHEY